MVIITNISYPAESAQEVASRFIEAPQLPSYMNRHGPYINASLEEGIISISLVELDDADLAQGMKDLGDYMATFFGVPGWKYQIRPFFKAEEALKMIGMG